MYKNYTCYIKSIEKKEQIFVRICSKLKYDCRNVYHFIHTCTHVSKQKIYLSSIITRYWEIPNDYSCIHIVDVVNDVCDISDIIHLRFNDYALHDIQGDSKQPDVFEIWYSWTNSKTIFPLEKNFF